MTFAVLKNLVKKLGGLLVMDGDEPVLVMLSYDKYQRMESGEGRHESPGHSEFADGASDGDEANVEKLNQEILALKEEIRHKEEAELIEHSGSPDALAEVVDLD